MCLTSVLSSLHFLMRRFSCSCDFLRALPSTSTYAYTNTKDQADSTAPSRQGIHSLTRPLHKETSVPSCTILRIGGRPLACALTSSFSTHFLLFSPRFTYLWSFSYSMRNFSRFLSPTSSPRTCHAERERERIENKQEGYSPPTPHTRLPIAHQVIGFTQSTPCHPTRAVDSR